MKSSKTLSYVLIALVLVVGIAVSARGYITSVKNPEPSQNPLPDDKPRSMLVVKLYYQNESKGGDVCTDVYSVERQVPFTERVGDATLRELFRGPTAAEKKAGYSSLFEASANTKPGTKSLGEYYLGLRIEEGTAFVNFSRDALEYLNAPACMQSAVKTSIEQTLKQFPTIQNVQYEIDGKLFDAWDA